MPEVEKIICLLHSGRLHLAIQRQKHICSGWGMCKYFGNNESASNKVWLLAEMPGQSVPATSMRDEAVEDEEEGQSSSTQQQLQEPEALDDEDIAIYKRRIADILQPGETVLEGLRRLGTLPTAGMAGLSAGATAVASSGQLAPSRGRKVPEQHRSVTTELG